MYIGRAQLWFCAARRGVFSAIGCFNCLDLYPLKFNSSTFWSHHKSCIENQNLGKFLHKSDCLPSIKAQQYPTHCLQCYHFWPKNQCCVKWLQKFMFWYTICISWHTYFMSTVIAGLYRQTFIAFTFWHALLFNVYHFDVREQNCLCKPNNFALKEHLPCLKVTVWPRSVLLKMPLWTSCVMVYSPPPSHFQSMIVEPILWSTSKSRQQLL